MRKLALYILTLCAFASSAIAGNTLIPSDTLSGGGGGGGAYVIVTGVTDSTHGSNTDITTGSNEIDPLSGNSNIMGGGGASFPNKIGTTNANEALRRPQGLPVINGGAWPTQAAYTAGDATFGGIGPGAYDTVVQDFSGKAWVNHGLIGARTAGAGAGHNTIIGGSFLAVMGDCGFSLVMGGNNNWIECFQGGSTSGNGNSILSGEENQMEMTSADGVTASGDTANNLIVGGNQNVIKGIATNDFILSGSGNMIDDGAATIKNQHNVILSGLDNIITPGPAATTSMPSFAMAAGANTQAWLSGQRTFGTGNYDNTNTVAGQFTVWDVPVRNNISGNGGDDSNGRLLTQGNRLVQPHSAAVWAWTLNGTCVISSQLVTTGEPEWRSWNEHGTILFYGTGSTSWTGKIYKSDGTSSTTTVSLTHYAGNLLSNVTLRLAFNNGNRVLPIIDDPDGDDPNCGLNFEVVETR